MSSKTTKFESLLEAVPDALVGMDQAGVIRFVNHQTESLFGYDRDNLVGQPIQTLVPEYPRGGAPSTRMSPSQTPLPSPWDSTCS
jgi:PAS domain S-box-containing protein